MNVFRQRECYKRTLYTSIAPPFSSTFSSFLPSSVKLCVLLFNTRKCSRSSRKRPCIYFLAFSFSASLFPRFFFTFGVNKISLSLPDNCRLHFSLLHRARCKNMRNNPSSISPHQLQSGALSSITFFFLWCISSSSSFFLMGRLRHHHRRGCCFATQSKGKKKEKKDENI